MKNLRDMVKECTITVRGLDATGYPENELGYFRMYFKDGTWWGTAFPIHVDLMTDKVVHEFDDVIRGFRNGFKSLNDLLKFCRNKGFTLHDWNGHDRFIFHLITDLATYRFDVRDYPGDYHVYLHCYVKEG